MSQRDEFKLLADKIAILEFGGCPLKAKQVKRQLVTAIKEDPFGFLISPNNEECCMFLGW